MTQDVCKMHVRNSETHDGDVHYEDKVKGNIAHMIHLSLYDRFRIWFDVKCPTFSFYLFPFHY